MTAPLPEDRFNEIRALEPAEHTPEQLGTAILDLATEVLRLRAQLQLAVEFRIPCTNENGGYAEVVVQRGDADWRDRWGVTDGAPKGLRAWHDTNWKPIASIGRDTAYQYTLDQAMDLGHQIAELEGACTDAQVAALSEE